MNCFACQYAFPNNSSLLRHISLLHPGLLVYRCAPNENCNRSFSCFKSFKVHRVNKHTPQITEGVIDDTLDSAPINEDVSSAVLPEISCQEDNTFILSESHLDYNKNSFENFDSDNDLDDVEIVDKLKDIVNSESQAINSELHPQDSTIKSLREKALLFVAKMYDYPEIPRSRVQSIVDETSGLINEMVNMIREQVQIHFKPRNNSPEDVLKVTEIFDQFSKPFDNLQTEWRRLSNFVQRKTLILPEDYTIGERQEFRQKNNLQVLQHVEVTAQYIPMRNVFKKFFELPGVLEQTLDYLKSLQSNFDIISNFVQGSLWKSKLSSFGDKIVLPLFMYFDDYENNNPLGSHKGIAKCGAVYLSIPCLPPSYQSKLENIFLFALFNTLDRELFRNEIIFTKVIEELQFLEKEGITINLGTENVQVFFSLGLILGDNLGLHSILGFAESFQANYFCRFCLTRRNQCNEIFHEIQCIPRDISNYETHLKMNNLTMTGIKEECIFHKIPGFHVTKNLSVDVMHDLLEGICPSDMAKILHYFIYIAKFFSLQQLNDRIRGFYYGSKHNKNKPPEILEHYLKKKNRLAMSSAEMLCFTRHICMILGDLVHEENEHWKLLKLLKMIVEVLISTKVTSGTHEYLATSITEYLQSHMKLFPESMIPKHHFLLHYPKVMQIVGVLSKISSIRYESKHHEGKIISHSAASRVNVCHTIALRHQLRLNYRFLRKENLNSHYVIGPKKPFNNCHMFQTDVFPNILPSNLTENSYLVKWVRYESEIIQNDSIVMIPSEDGPVFHDVRCIILDGHDKLILMTRELLDCYFDPHTQSYRIVNIKNFDSKYLTCEDLQHAVITYKNHSSDGLYYITKKWM